MNKEDKISELGKGSTYLGITRKSKETSSQLEPSRNSHVAMMHQPVIVSSNVYPNACTKKHSLAHLQGLILLCNWLELLLIYFLPAKVGIKSFRCARECFICTCIGLYV